MIGRSIRNLNRYREIANILAKHGFGFWLQELGIHEMLSLPRRLIKNEKLPLKQAGIRIGRVLEDLGPTYVKLGQIASMRTDLFPEEIIWALERLQDQVHPFSVEEAFQIMEEEWEMTPQEIFQEFSKIPMAAASIGQVHRAVLYSGEEVAVKIQRPGIVHQVEADLAVLYDLVSFAEKRVKWVAYYQFKDILDEFAESLRNEMNYMNEARNAEKIRAQFKSRNDLHIPKIYWAYTTRRVLVMEYVSGIKVNKIAELEAAGFDRHQLAEQITEIILQQVLIDGFFHADPHPGNLFVTAEGNLMMLDFGMVGKLSKPLRGHFSSMVAGLMRKSSPAILRAVYQMGIVPDNVDRGQLRADIDALREKYYEVPLAEVGLGQAVQDLLSVAFKHRIRVPKDLTLVGRAFLTLEGVVEKLDPSFSVMDAAKPMGKQLMFQQIQPREVLSNTYDEAVDAFFYIKETPRLFADLLKWVKGEEFRLPLHLDDVPFLRKIAERIANRIAFSLVLLSFSLLMAALVLSSAIGGHDYFIWRFPMAEAGLVVAGVMFAMILWSIFRSGRF